MIARWLSSQIKALYIKGTPIREIQKQLSIDACIFKLAVHKSWNTKERKRLYRKKLRIRARS